MRSPLPSKFKRPISSWSRPQPLSLIAPMAQAAPGALPVQPARAALQVLAALPAVLAIAWPGVFEPASGVLQRCYRTLSLALGPPIRRMVRRSQRPRLRARSWQAPAFRWPAGTGPMVSLCALEVGSPFAVVGGKASAGRRSQPGSPGCPWPRRSPIRCPHRRSSAARIPPDRWPGLDRTCRSRRAGGGVRSS